MNRAGLAGVILAAGSSRRMRFPKHLLDVHGRSALAAIVAALREHLGGELILVSRPGEEEILGRAGVRRSRRLHPVINPRPDLGRTGSIQTGLRTLRDLPPRGEIRAAFIWPVDVPLVRSRTVARLARESLEAGENAALIPTWRGRGGHPVVLGRALWPSVLGLDADAPLRSLWRRGDLEVIRLEVSDPGICADLNTPADVRRWLATEPQAWRPPR